MKINWCVVTNFIIGTVLAFMLFGCQQLPTVQNCRDVVYERHGLDVKVTANCTVPLGPALPGL